MYRIGNVARRCEAGVQDATRIWRSMSSANEERARSYLNRHGLGHGHPHPVSDTASSVIGVAASLQIPRDDKSVKRNLPSVSGNIPSVAEIISVLRDDGGGVNVVDIDVSEKAAFTNAFVICTGRSAAHVAALSDQLVRDLRSRGVTVDGNIVGLGYNSSPDWKVVDAGFIVTHILLEPTRTMYDLETLWKSDNPPAFEEDGQ